MSRFKEISEEGRHTYGESIRVCRDGLVGTDS